jgi:hypothetical protein
VSALFLKKKIITQLNAQTNHHQTRCCPVIFHLGLGRRPEELARTGSSKCERMGE